MRKKVTKGLKTLRLQLSELAQGETVNAKLIESMLDALVKLEHAISVNDRRMMFRIFNELSKKVGRVS